MSDILKAPELGLQRGGLRAALLPAADAAKVRTLLLGYLEQRMLFYTTRDTDELATVGAKTPGRH